MTETTYDSNSDPEYFAQLNPIRVKTFGNVAVSASTATSSDISALSSYFSSSNLVSISETDYSYNSDYKARGIIGLPIESRIMNPGGGVLATTQTVYDNALPAADEDYGYALQGYSTGNSFDCSSDSQHPKICWENPNGPSGSINLAYRGLPTTQRVWYAEQSTWIKTNTRYDQFGNAVKKKDPIGNEASTSFDSQYKYAYPTSITAPAPDPNNTGHGTNQTSTATTSYDLTTGLPLSVTDDFGQVTTTEYDAVLRPFRVNPVVINSSPTGPKAETSYGQPDSNGQLPANQRFVKVRKQIDANNWDEAITWFDGLGRTIKTQAKDAQGDIFVDTVYDIYGRVDRVTNPYRTGDIIYWSRTRYDAAGRAVETYAPATQSEIDYADTHSNSGLTSLGVTSFDISTITNSAGNFIGTVVISKDASGRRSRSITNALGQLVRVDEPTATGGSTADADLGTLAEPAQPTYYKYDVYGKMVQVVQGDQSRFFKYDSLGRLLRVKQPEQEVNSDLATSGNPNNNSWTAGFAYDVLGNVVRATDANGVNIINEYDRANRVVKRCYTKPNFNTTATTCNGIGSGDASTDTPPVSFWYDGTGLQSQQSPNYAKGKLTKVDNTVSATLYTLFDNFGRLTATEQRTPVDGETTSDAPARTSTFTYNLSGALVSETYPSGRIVKNEFASDGDLTRVTSKRAGSELDKPYVSNFVYTASGGISQMKLGNGRWESATFDPRRLQITDLGLGSSATDSGLWKIHYDYGEIEENGSLSASKNTGNIAKQTLTVPGASFVQTYKYDELYRLKEAKETPGGSSTANWTQSWTYDRYGNRLTFSQNIGGQTSSYNPTLDSANNNRFATGQGFTYDKNGNIVNDIDPLTSNTRQFVFNGDNKQIEVKDTSVSPNVTKGTYYYDGEGKRVKKIADGQTTIFVYSSGKLVAEYSTAVEPVETAKIAYTTTDHLGSPRIITDDTGTVRSRRDFMPFGEELHSGVGARTGDNGLKYASETDNVRQKFTGYQKDTETSLDFAEARMYENRFGRFTAVDPLIASGKSANPQTFNRYAYTSNNPVIRIDTNGKDWYMVRTETLGYNNRHAYIWTPVWYDRTTYGAQKWNLGAVFYMGKGQYKGMWATLDPWNNRWTLSDSQEKAQQALDAYRSRMRQDVVGGVVYAISDTADGLINPVLRPAVGSPARHVADAGLRAAGINADENSDVGRTTYHTANAAIITLSMVAPEALGARGELLTEAGSASETITTVSTLEPGPFAGEYIPARGTGKLNGAEQAEIDRIGSTTGCHTCGATDPGTPNGQFIGDHQGPSGLVTPERIYPHCYRCSPSQGGVVKGVLDGRFPNPYHDH